MRRSVELQIITEALTKMGPHTPAARIWGRAPGASVEEGASGNVWAGDPHDVALHIVTRLFGRPDTTAELSPLAQAAVAKANRDIGAEIGVLTRAEHALTSAPWYPVRPGDMVHVHYEAGGEMPAFGETYVIGDAAEPGGVPPLLLSMVLLAHTLPASTPEDDVRAMTGCFEAEAADDPLYDLWFEAGPRRLSIVRDGQVVHNGPGAAPVSGTLQALVATIADAARYLGLGQPELARDRLRTGRPLPPCGVPGPMPEHADCARPSGHRGAHSPDAGLAEPPHQCPALPEQLHAVVYIDHPGRSVRFGGLYADEGDAVEVANDAAYGYGSALTETTPGPGGHPLILLPADGVPGVPVVAVVGLQLLPDPRAELAWAEECRDAGLSPEDDDHGDDYGDPGDGDYDADQNGEA